MFTFVSHLHILFPPVIIRKVFNICTKQAKSRNWTELGLEMKDKVLRFEVLAEDEWEAKLNQLLCESM
jgi:hypothetical protein